jgi:hypothetical protein
MNRRGQIQEVDTSRFNARADPQNLALYLKNAEKMVSKEYAKAARARHHGSSGRGLHSGLLSKSDIAKRRKTVVSEKQLTELS